MILTEDLGMQRVMAKYLPKLLSLEQHQLSLEVAQDMLECIQHESWIPEDCDHWGPSRGCMDVTHKPRSSLHNGSIQYP
jgi:hypothetical protein